MIITKGIPRLALLIVAICLCNGSISAQTSITEFFPEIDFLQSNGPADGYYFMGSKGLTADGACHYLAIIDNYGTPVFFRKMNKATSSMRPLADGRIAYLNGVPRTLYFLNDWLEETTSILVDADKPNGHDWDITENGHVLLMGEMQSTVDMSQIIEGGNPQAEVLDLIVAEYDESFNLLSSWNSAEHFDILDGNETSSYLNFLEEQIDYVHANAISVDSDTSFLISCRHMDEITKIDRRSGEIIWRLGGKKNQFEIINDTIGFSHQHSIRALNNGHILLFDNGNLHSELVSSAIEYKIDEENKTATLVKRYTRNPNVYSNHQGAVQRIHNGNTLLNWGPYWPSFTEFHPDGTTALEWDFTKHSYCPGIEKYLWQTKVFTPASDSLDFGLWESDSTYQELSFKNNSPDTIQITTVETRTNYFGVETQLPVKIAPEDSTKLKLWFNPSEASSGFSSDMLTVACDSESQRIARQIKVNGHKTDTNAPFAELKNGTNAIPLSANIHIGFSEPIRTSSNQLNYNSVDSFLILKKENAQGEDIPFNAVISSDNKTITLTPETNLEKSTNYFISLKEGLYDYSGNSLENFSAYFSTVISSVEVTEQIDFIKVYPIPTRGELILNLGSNPFGYSYILTNTQGTIVKQGIAKENIVTIDFSKLTRGIYFLMVQKDKTRFTKKILKI